MSFDISAAILEGCGRPSVSTSSGATQSRTFAELLIHCEEDRVLRAVLVGMLREADCWTLGFRRDVPFRATSLAGLGFPEARRSIAFGGYLPSATP